MPSMECQGSCAAAPRYAPYLRLIATLGTGRRPTQDNLLATALDVSITLTRWPLHSGCRPCSVVVTGQRDMRLLEQRFGRHPRILNQLHHARLMHEMSHTNELELATIARVATGLRTALEIGTHQGVSAARSWSAQSRGG
jgi:hypothetical protein